MLQAVTQYLILQPVVAERTLNILISNSCLPRSRGALWVRFSSWSLQCSFRRRSYGKCAFGLWVDQLVKRVIGGWCSWSDIDLWLRSRLGRCCLRSMTSRRSMSRSGGGGYGWGSWRSWTLSCGRRLCWSRGTSSQLLHTSSSDLRDVKLASDLW